LTTIFIHDIIHERFNELINEGEAKMENIISEMDYDSILEEKVVNAEDYNVINEELLNFDVNSYEFEDQDLEMAVKRLSRRDQDIITLYLMGHTQEDIGRAYNVSRSMISKRFRVIINKITRYIC
jgi:DNA-directed RNA polymerase specialized sigma subunit